MNFISQYSHCKNIQILNVKKPVKGIAHLEILLIGVNLQMQIQSLSFREFRVANFALKLPLVGVRRHVRPEAIFRSKSSWTEAAGERFNA